MYNTGYILGCYIYTHIYIGYIFGGYFGIMEKKMEATTSKRDLV